MRKKLLLALAGANFFPLLDWETGTLACPEPLIALPLPLPRWLKLPAGACKFRAISFLSELWRESCSTSALRTSTETCKP